MSTHTPGPWVARHGRIYGPRDERSRHPEGRILIGGVTDESTGWESPYGATAADIERRDVEAEAAANAALMSAAPEMLDAIERILEHYDRGLPDHMIEELRAAAAKARKGAK